MSVNLDFDYGEAILAMEKYSDDDMDTLRRWTQRFDVSKIVPKDLSDKQLVLFYNACYGDVKKSKVALEKYYHSRRNAPEIFNHRVFIDEELRISSEIMKMCILPSKSCESYHIFYQGFEDSDPLKFYNVAVCKLIFMVADLWLLKRGPHSGFILLFDMKGVKLGHLARINILVLQKFMEYVQEGLPVRIKGIHILNTGPVIDKFLALAKPFISKELFEIINLHNSNEDPAKLNAIIPKSSLPSDYGGTLPDSRTLHQQCMQELRNIEPYFCAEEQQRYAALPDKMGANTLEGTFRSLDID